MNAMLRMAWMYRWAVLVVGLTCGIAYAADGARASAADSENKTAEVANLENLVAAIGHGSAEEWTKQFSPFLSRRNNEAIALSRMLLSEGNDAQGKLIKGRACFLLGELRVGNSEVTNNLVSVIGEEYIGPRVKDMPYGILNPASALYRIGKPALRALINGIKKGDDKKIRYRSVTTMRHIVGEKAKTDELLARQVKTVQADLDRLVLTPESKKKMQKAVSRLKSAHEMLKGQEGDW